MFIGNFYAINLTVPIVWLCKSLNFGCFQLVPSTMNRFADLVELASKRRSLPVPGDARCLLIVSLTCLPVQPPVLYRFGKVLAADSDVAGEIGNRAGQFKYPGIASG